MDYQDIVVPYDFSDPVRPALATAVDFAKRFGARLHLVHVVQWPAYSYAAFPGTGAPPAPVGLADGAGRLLEDVAGEIPDGVEVRTHVHEGSNVALVLAETARKLEADLIVMGTHGRTGFAHVFLGSVAERLLRSAPCPVLVVPAAREE